MTHESVRWGVFLCTRSQSIRVPRRHDPPGNPARSRTRCRGGCRQSRVSGLCAARTASTQPPRTGTRQWWWECSRVSRPTCIFPGIAVPVLSGPQTPADHGRTPRVAGSDTCARFHDLRSARGPVSRRKPIPESDGSRNAVDTRAATGTSPGVRCRAWPGGSPACRDPARRRGWRSTGGTHTGGSPRISRGRTPRRRR